MVKYFDIEGSSTLMKFNKETEEMTGLINLAANIDWIWLADEDGELNGQEVKAGDVVIRMYGIGGDRYSNKEVYVIKDENLKNYYKRCYDYYNETPKKELCDASCEDCCCDKA